MPLHPEATGKQPPAPRERSDLESDPLVDGNTSVLLWAKYHAAHACRPAPMHRPHSRVLGKVVREHGDKAHTYRSLAKVCSEAEVATVRTLRTSGRADIEQLEDTVVRSKADFLRRLALLLDAYVLAALDHGPEEKPWVTKQEAYDYLVFVELRASQSDIDLAKLIDAEHQTRLTWADRVAFFGERLGAAISSSPDRCTRFWGDLSQGRKRALDAPNEHDRKKAKGGGKGTQLSEIFVLNVKGGTQLCGDFNYRSCTRPREGPNKCKFDHRCAVPGCDGSSPKGHAGKDCPRLRDFRR